MVATRTVLLGAVVDLNLTGSPSAWDAGDGSPSLAGESGRFYLYLSQAHC